MWRKRTSIPVAVVVVAALALGGWALANARGGGGRPPPAASGAPATGAAVAACRPTAGELGGQADPVAAGATPRVTLGPSERLAGSAAAVRAGRRGEPLVISGRVLAADCTTPVAGASLHVWQTNGDGDYGISGGSAEVECCYLQGTMTTGADGRYEFTTVRPGHYNGVEPPPAAHIHVEVRHPDGRGVTTEILFADDPAGGRGAGEVIRLTRTAGTPWQGRFDIVLGTA